MLDTAKKFHDLGFAIHWLKARSKRPVESKWTTGPRKTFKELKAAYQKGMNVGVRLGPPSMIKVEGRTRYLAVIDCDVKSEEKKHLVEMDQKLRSLFPGINRAAIVASGRGNGSRHYYVVTKKPVASKRLAQSAEKVKVRMPSSEPSRYEKEHLSEAELARGIRLKAAWEISLMGDGSQVVLPPSIHPDTGRRYEWTREWQAPFVLRGLEASTAPKAEAREMGSLERDIDLKARGVPDNIIAMIEDGVGVEDRSAALFKVAMSLLKAGLSEEEVVSVLTEKDSYLGSVAYDHAKTTNRERAAKWIVKYTLPRAKQETDPGRDFMEEPPKKLAKKAAKAQMAELVEEFASSWETKIERGPANLGAKVKPTLKNLILIMENAVGPQIFRYNAFSSAELYGMNTPWGGRKGDELKDSDSVDMKVWFANNWRVEPNTNLINEAVCHIGKKNVFHPVKDYLDQLEWDGVERIDTWLKDYMQASAPEPYLSAVSRKMLVAMVARAYEPGRKFDQVVILQGNQGKGKSTALRKLVGDEWFSDATLNLTDKDSVLSMRSIWLRELGELSGMRKADVEQLKEFISRATDRIRVPYGRKTEAFPRQCIFVGTTNKDEYFRDDTGNRRYWPVSVGKCDFDGVEVIRDQLFAEARVAWELGEPLYLENEEAEKVAVQEQEKRMESDMLVEQVRKFIRLEKKKPENERFDFTKFQLSDAFQAGTFVTLKEDRIGQIRAASALRALGFTKKVSRNKRGILGKYWVCNP